MTPHHKGRGQMFTREAVIYDDSNLNKNEFTAVVSFAVNFHFFPRATDARRTPSPRSRSCLITPLFKWREKGRDGEKRDGEKGWECDGKQKEGGVGRGRGMGERERMKRRKDGEGNKEVGTDRACYFQSRLRLYCLPHACRTRARGGGKKRGSSHRFQKVSLPFWQMWCQLCCLIKRKWRWWLRHRRDLIW